MIQVLSANGERIIRILCIEYGQETINRYEINDLIEELKKIADQPEYLKDINS